MSDGDNLRALIQERVVFIKKKFARVIHRNDTKPRALLFAEHLPGDYVRVMLHSGDYDLVALANGLAPVAVHHKIDAFGCAAHEDALTRLARVYETLHLLTRAFVSSRGFLAQVVDAAMNVRVFLFQINAASINHNLRNLRRRSIIQIDERLSVYGLTKHRKIFAYALDIPFEFSLRPLRFQNLFRDAHKLLCF